MTMQKVMNKFRQTINIFAQAKRFSKKLLLWWYIKNIIYYIVSKILVFLHEIKQVKLHKQFNLQKFIRTILRFTTFFHLERQGEVRGGKRERREERGREGKSEGGGERDREGKKEGKRGEERGIQKERGAEKERERGERGRGGEKKRDIITYKIKLDTSASIAKKKLR